MYDSNLEFSSDITLTPKKVDGGYEITLVASSEWLHSEERVYPVTIDPIIATSPNRDDIVDTYIYPNDVSNTGKGNAHILRVGSTSYSDINTNRNPFRSLIKFSLPNLKSGDQIIDAELHIFNYQDTDSWNPPSGNVQIDIHAVTKDWNETNASWNSMKDAYDKNHIVDYIKYSYDTKDANKENTADITSLVKDWYVSGNNYGILLKEHTEKKVSGRNDVSFISSDTSSAYTYKRPYIIIQYRNQTGLEDYLTTHEQNIGRTTTYTNDYNGNLTLFHFDTATPGSRFPVSIYHVYNTNDKESNIGYGYGFRLNLNQTLENISLSGIPYLEYIDEDGTRHYFYNDSGTWKDEDGLNLTITASGNDYLMKDKGGNESTFVKNGNKWYLKEIKDTNNNKITIHYASNSNQITSVVDAVGDTLTLQYESNLLTSIKDTNERLYQYTYTNNHLIGITYPDNLQTKYEYTNTKLLSKVTNVDNSYLTYEYYAKSPYRIKKVTEYGNKGTAGNFLTMTYGSNTTSFKDNKGNVENYTFNHLGQTLNINSLDQNQSLKGAYGKSYQYGSGDSDKNRLLLESTLVKNTRNLLLNGGAENGFENWETVGAVQLSGDTYSGKNSFQLQGNSTKQKIYQSVSLEKNKTYTLSAYVKGNAEACYTIDFVDATGQNRNFCIALENSRTDEWERVSTTIKFPESIRSINSLGFSLVMNNGKVLVDNIQLEESEGTNPYNLVENGDFSRGLEGWERQNNLGTNDKVVTVDGINAFQMTGEMEKWKHLYNYIPQSGKKGDVFRVNFWAKNNGVARKGSKEAKLVLHYLDASGNALSYEVIPVSNDTNSWQYLSDTFVAKQDFDSLKIILAYNYNANDIYFTNVAIYKDDYGNSYSYDSSGNVISTSDLANQKSRYFYDSKNELIGALSPQNRMFYYEYDYRYTNRLLSSFNQNGLATSYEYDDYGNVIRNKVIEPAMIRDASEIEENTYYYLRPVVTNLMVGVSNTNVELIDGFKKWKFVKSGDDYLIVDEENRAMTVKDSNKANETNVLVSSISNGNNQKYKLSNNNDGTFSFQTKVTDYKSCIDISGAIYTKARNMQQYGCNLTDAQKYMILPIDSTSKYIETGAEYTQNGNYQTKIIDQRGKESTTTYNEVTGTITNVKDAKGNIVEYTYDNNDRVLTSSQTDTGVVNSYTYDKDLLTQITHNSFDYTFTYDEYGNTKSIKVAGSPLITHQYEDNNGHLLKSTYGNNDIVNYEYDSFGRISKEINMSGTATYSYNNRGFLSHISYLNNDIFYDYDLSGRIMNKKENNFQTKYHYDNYNHLDNIKYNYKSNSNSISYTYDLDNKLEKIGYSNSDIHYTYDNLERLIKKEIKKGNKTYTTTYEYYDVDNSKTTTLLKSITNGNTKLEYTYDDNGNILTITENGTLIKRYGYDSLNQLTKDYINIRDYINYVYDSGGNRTKIQKVTHTKKIILSRPFWWPSYETLSTYGYDSEWKDQLTTVGDKTITYDSIGNMTSYDGYNYIWTNGNELKSITKDSNEYKYEYSIDGIRTKKTVNGKVTNYYLEGSNIIYEDRDGKVISYLYDESGISGFIFNNKTYYFVKNVQGDIIEVLDEEFETVAKYTYDNWGVVTTENLTEENIGDINPYRYRGYYYDTETNLYYLNSRYYHPELGRFISADSILGANEDMLSYNLYIYCSNNPIMYSDPSGKYNMLVEVSKYVRASMVRIATDVLAKIGGKTVNYKLSEKMLYHSLHGNGKKLSKEILSELQASIASSTVTRSKIKETIRNCEKDNFSITSSLVYDSGDLHYSVGKAKLKLRGQRYDGVWLVKVDVSDTYNFDEYRKGFSISNVLNNYGYNLYQSGIAVSYDWEISYYEFYK